MTQFVLNPMKKQLFQVEQPQQSRPRVSFIRAMWVRFIVWSSKASLSDVRRALLRCLYGVGIPAGVLMPYKTFSAILEAMQWRHFAIPTIACIFFVLCNWKKAWRWYARRRLLKDRPENQYTFQGAPVGQLCDFLKKTDSFKRDAALATLRISQPQYGRIAAALKDAGILVHGENNAHVMRPIGRTILMRQLEALAEGVYPPYKYDEERDFWYERDGGAASLIINNEFKTRRLEEKEQKRVERRKREVARLDTEIEERKEILQAASPFATLFAHSPHTP